MRIFLYEFVTGGGWSACFDNPPSEGLAREGQAMRDAMAADLKATGAVEVVSLPDRPLPGEDEERAAFQQAARQSDATLIIAPEFDEILATRHRWALAAGARVLGCGLDLIELAADKHRTVEHLARRGIQVPPGMLIFPGTPLPHDFSYPAVLKPVDGAGSLQTYFIRHPADLPLVPPSQPAAPGTVPILRSERSKMGLSPSPRRWRLEQFCPGLAASVAFLCGPAGAIALPPCRQLLAGTAQDHSSPFAYCGGELPLPPELARRATCLGQRVVATLDRRAQGPLGWLGIDLVLGDDLAGADDVVIEINPRLTTSYLGLRRLAIGNLAAALLAVAGGQPDRLSFRGEPLQFAPDGRILSEVR